MKWRMMRLSWASAAEKSPELELELVQQHWLLQQGRGDGGSGALSMVEVMTKSDTD